MSGNLGGQVRTLPFTGLTVLPFMIIGLALTCVGALMLKLAPKKIGS
jgi:hypothetical protein